MPRKTRRARPRSLNLPADSSPFIAARAQTERPEPPSPTTTPATVASGSKRVDFSVEYHYIIGDLRKMAIIALSMFIVLIALSFVIR